MTSVLSTPSHVTSGLEGTGGLSAEDRSWQRLPRTNQACWDRVQEQAQDQDGDDDDVDAVVTWIVCVRGDLRSQPVSYLVHRRLLVESLESLSSFVTELPAEEAACVPELLHFLYKGELAEQGEDVDNDDVDELPFLSLYHLAHRLEARALMKAVAEFYVENVLTMSNVLDVIRAAERLPGPVDNSNNPLREATLEWAAANASECTPARARRLPPNLLLDILQRNQQLSAGRRLEPLVTSKLVAHCLSRSMNHRLTPPETLDQLTDEDLIPFLHPAFEAPTLLLADCLIHGAKEGRGESPEKLSSLQERCLQSMTTYWHTCYAGFSSSASLNLNVNLSENNFLPTAHDDHNPSSEPIKISRTMSSRSLMSNLSGGTHGGFQRDVADQALLDYLQYLPRHVVKELHDKAAKKCTCRQHGSPTGMSLMTGLNFPYGRSIDEDENGGDTFNEPVPTPASKLPRKPATKDELAKCLLESVKHIRIKRSLSQEETTDTETDTQKSDDEESMDNHMVDTYFDDLLDSSEDEEDDEDYEEDEDDDENMFHNTSIFRMSRSTALGGASSSDDDNDDFSDDDEDELRLVPIEEHHDDFYVHNVHRSEMKSDQAMIVRRFST